MVDFSTIIASANSEDSDSRKVEKDPTEVTHVLVLAVPSGECVLVLDLLEHLRKDSDDTGRETDVAKEAGGTGGSPGTTRSDNMQACKTRKTSKSTRTPFDTSTLGGFVTSLVMFMNPLASSTMSVGKHISATSSLSLSTSDAATFWIDSVQNSGERMRICVLNVGREYVLAAICVPAGASVMLNGGKSQSNLATDANEKGAGIDAEYSSSKFKGKNADNVTTLSRSYLVEILLMNIPALSRMLTRAFQVARRRSAEQMTNYTIHTMAGSACGNRDDQHDPKRKTARDEGSHPNDVSAAAEETLRLKTNLSDLVFSDICKRLSHWESTRLVQLSRSSAFIFAKESVGILEKGAPKELSSVPRSRLFNAMVQFLVFDNGHQEDRIRHMVCHPSSRTRTRYSVWRQQPGGVVGDVVFVASKAYFYLVVEITSQEVADISHWTKLCAWLEGAECSTWNFERTRHPRIFELFEVWEELLTEAKMPSSTMSEALANPSKEKVGNRNGTPEKILAGSHQSSPSGGVLAQNVPASQNASSPEEGKAALDTKEEIVAGDAGAIRKIATRTSLSRRVGCDDQNTQTSVPEPQETIPHGPAQESGSCDETWRVLFPLVLPFLNWNEIGALRCTCRLFGDALVIEHYARNTTFTRASAAKKARMWKERRSASPASVSRSGPNPGMSPRARHAAEEAYNAIEMKIRAQRDTSLESPQEGSTDKVTPKVHPDSATNSAKEVVGTDMEKIKEGLHTFELGSAVAFVDPKTSRQEKKASKTFSCRKMDVDIHRDSIPNEFESGLPPRRTPAHNSAEVTLPKKRSRTETTSKKKRTIVNRVPDGFGQDRSVVSEGRRETVPHDRSEVVPNSSVPNPSDRLIREKTTLEDLTENCIFGGRPTASVLLRSGSLNAFQPRKVYRRPGRNYVESQLQTRILGPLEESRITGSVLRQRSLE